MTKWNKCLLCSKPGSEGTHWIPSITIQSSYSLSTSPFSAEETETQWIAIIHPGSKLPRKRQSRDLISDRIAPGVWERARKPSPSQGLASNVMETSAPETAAECEPGHGHPSWPSLHSGGEFSCPRHPGSNLTNLCCCLVQGPCTTHLKCCLLVPSRECSYFAGEKDVSIHKHTPKYLELPKDIQVICGWKRPVEEDALIQK